MPASVNVAESRWHLGAALAKTVAKTAPVPSHNPKSRSSRNPAIEEILRLHGPLVSNRRTAVRPVVIGGRRIEAGERMTVIWTSANRDARVFEAADRYCPERGQEPNLLYGAGIHICPGAALARMQLSVMIDELLSRIRPFSLLTDAEPLRAVYPASGFASVSLQIDR
jgi:cytochrome P450